MKCRNPECRHDKTKVTQTRKYDTVVERRRKCLKCGYTWTTHEETRENV